MNLDGSIIDDLIVGIEDFNSNSKPKDNRFQDLPCEVDYLQIENQKEIRGKLVPFIIGDRKFPVLQFTYHYGFKQICNVNDKIVCVNYSKLSNIGIEKKFDCPVCEFLNNSEHYSILKTFNYMSWKNIYPFNKKYIKNPAALAKLEYYRKTIYNLNPSMINYFLFIPKPFKKEIKIVRVYSQYIPNILKKIKSEDLNLLYSVFTGKDTVFKIKKKSIADIEFVDGDHLVSNKKDDIDIIKKTIQELDILKRMDIVIHDEKYYQDLVVEYYEIMMEILKNKYKIIFDKDDNKFIPIDYIGNDTNNDIEEPPLPEIEPEEDSVDIDLGDDIPF